MSLLFAYFYITIIFENYVNKFKIDTSLIYGYIMYMYV